MSDGTGTTPVTPITPITPVAPGMTPEEIRLEMRRRFDAVNSAAQESRRVRLESEHTKYEAKNPPASKPTTPASEAGPEMGENDSSGG